MITYFKLGFYHPSNANWNYGIWAIIDDTGVKLYKETFGGDSRMQAKHPEAKELHGISAYGQWRGREVSEMSDIESYTGKNY